MERLKPCPFCGEEAKIEKQRFSCTNYWIIGCQSCGVQTKAKFYEEDAIEA